MKTTKKTLLIALAIAVPVCLGGGYLLAKRVLWPRYKEYRAASFERSAREFLDKGDYENAMLFVRKNLVANQQSTANWRLAAEISEKRQSPQALYYRKRLLALEPTLDNRLRLIRLALELRADTEAENALAGAGPEARDSAEFHELAARACLRTGNTVQAKYHLITLCELRPDNRVARLDLAEIRLAEASADDRPGIRSEIRALANDPTLRARALARLLTDATAHNEKQEALDLAAQLQREPELTVPHAVAIAQAIARFDAAALPEYITRLEQLAGDRPTDITRVGLFLITSGRADEAKSWLGRLPETVVTNVLVQRLNASVLAELRQWGELETFLRRGNWKDFEFERLSLLALAQRQQGNNEAFPETWRLALTNAADNSVKLEMLLQSASRWGWPDQRIEVLWRLFDQNPRNTTAQQQLFAYEQARRNTANINRLFSRLLEVSPNDPASKNNYAYTALLLGNTSTRAVNLAREASTADPKNPFFATTYALALLRTGQPAQARAVLDSISTFQLWQPERAIVHAAVLAADNASDQAEVLVANIDASNLLPEERQLLEDTRAAIARQRRETARSAQIAETLAAHRGAAAKSILPLLPPALRDQPPLPLELADSLYSRDEFASLLKEFGTTPWEKHDFVRLALLAYASRQLGDTTAARESWRLAVNAAGTRTDLQRTLATLAGTWAWEEERIALLARILQREPGDQALVDELVTYYTRQKRTADLARTYGSTLDVAQPSAANRARFAYYSLLVGTNTSEAHVAAKAAFDQNPADLLAARALALSLWRQGQSRAGMQILGSQQVRIAPEVEMGLVLALLHEADGDRDGARKLLAGYDLSSALPEEKTLAAELSSRLDAAQ